jgi:hypothetical protein
MMKKISLGIASIALALAPTASFAASSFSYNLRLTVPVHCTVKHQGMGYGATDGNAVSLGTFREYCNAPGGYQLVVNYAPGSLRGARIFAGSDEIVLDGSGQAVLSRATGPRMQERIISMAPGTAGFDTDRLELNIIPS